jgi:hypothetical protein
MGSIPLPALDVKTPQQPDMMGEMGNVMRLQALRQQMANAPLQTQALQQQVQAGQMENQQRQLQLNDQQAMTKAMQQWDGKDLSALPSLVLKNGGSATAVIGLKQKSLEMQKQYSDIAAQDATTGSKNIETQMKRADMLSGALSTVIQAPDDQLPQVLTATAQDLAQKGLLDPQHAQAAAQLAQTGNPAQIRQQLDLMRKQFMAQSQLMDEAQKKAATEASQTTAMKNQAEMKFYQQNGGAPGVPVEAMQQADWLKKNPGKGPSDFLLWKLQHTPQAMMMGNMLAGPQNQDALDFAANNYRQTGQMPGGLYRSPGTTQAIIARAAQLDQQAGGGGIAANKATLGSYTDALKKLQTNYSSVQAFEQTAEANMNLLQQTAQKIPDLGSRFANVPVRMINAKMIGTDNMAAFKTALTTAQTEAAKVLNSSNASGVLSDSSRHELQDVIDGNMPYSALVASLNTLKQDMANRTQAYQGQISDLQNRIRTAGGAAPSPEQPAAQAPSTIGVGAVIMQNGHRYKVTAVDKNGKPTAAEPVQ